MQGEEMVATAQSSEVLEGKTRIYGGCGVLSMGSRQSGRGNCKKKMLKKVRSKPLCV